MRILADENIPLLDAFCGDLGTLTRVDGRSLQRSQVLDADVLLVRSVTRVDASLLAGTPVRFVGTATIGTDHVDAAWLEQQGIAFASAPGCNAASVVQYVLSTISLFLQLRPHQSLGALSVGVIGAGNVGGTLVTALEGLGVQVKVSDPPRQLAGAALPFAPLDEVLACDVVSLHTPLVTEGPHPTWHLLDAHRLGRLNEGQLLINSGRGVVVDNQALLDRLQQPDPPLVALDVWENEPAPLAPLVEACWLATPHIAGYSLEGKSRGTEMIARALSQWAGHILSTTLDDLLPAPPVRALELSGQAQPLEALHRALMTCYDPRDDDARLRGVFAASSKAGGTGVGPAFDALRRNYPVRREPGSLVVRVPAGETARSLARAGFEVSVIPEPGTSSGQPAAGPRYDAPEAGGS